MTGRRPRGSMTELDLTLEDPAATARLGLCLSGALRAGDVVALSGQLGAGKSVLARGIIASLCPDEADIPSPTFTLVQTYEPENGVPLMHFDLYRLEAAEDALDLGIEDAFVEAVSLIEWPERLGPWLPRQALQVTLRPDPANPNARLAHLSGGSRWQALLSDLPASFG